ncbi:MAG: hypothetical protein JWN14_3311, partial [Chthonomonadales bacterium]|nr:hypothetical protein [Chthonomonadales bacterium]
MLRAEAKHFAKDFATEYPLKRAHFLPISLISSTALRIGASKS